MWQKRQRAGTEKNNNTTKSHNSLLRVHNIYLSTKAARVLLGSTKIKNNIKIKNFCAINKEFCDLAHFVKI